MRPQANWMLAGQQQIEQNAQCINIGRSGDRLAGELLGCGALRREGRTTLAREQGRGTCLPFTLEQFGDPEIQQFHFTVFANQHIRWLDIPMENAPVNIKPALVAIEIDGCAVDVFQDQIGLARRRHTRIE